MPAMTEKRTEFHQPTKPYNIIAAINRAAAATGSCGYAQATHFADYNGHWNNLGWNDYRRYYIGEYTWSGRNVFIRSSDFLTALVASIEEYDSQGLGASLHIHPFTEEDINLCRANVRLIEGKEDESKQEWRTWKFSECHFAVRNNWSHHLIAASSKEEFLALCYPGPKGGK